MSGAGGAGWVVVTVLVAAMVVPLLLRGTWAGTAPDGDRAARTAPPHGAVGRLTTGRRASARLAGLAAAAGALLLIGLPVRWVVPAAILTSASVAAWQLWLRRGEHRARTAVQRRVLDLCEHLAADLSAGQPPGVALERASRQWPTLAPVAEAFRVGADVPMALRDLGAVPGADDLRLLAAAWQVAHRTGQGLAAAVDRVGQQLLEARATRRLVQGELSSARATARLVAVLPVLALAMGSGVGGSPVRFLLTEPVGWACLAGGLGAGLLGLGWIEAIARDVDQQT